MINVEDLDDVAITFEALSRFNFCDLDGERGSLEAERLGAAQHTARATGPPQSKPFRAALQRHRAHQSDHAEQMIRVKVRKEDVFERKRDSVAHHLPLRAFAAIEHQRLAFAMHCERRHIALDSWSSSGCSEKQDAEGHGASNIEARLCLRRRRWTTSCGTIHTLTLLASQRCSHAEIEAGHTPTQASVQGATSITSRHRVQDHAAPEVRSAGVSWIRETGGSRCAHHGWRFRNWARRRGALCA